MHLILDTHYTLFLTGGGRRSRGVGTRVRQLTERKNTPNRTQKRKKGGDFNVLLHSFDN